MREGERIHRDKYGMGSYVLAFQKDAGAEKDVEITELGQFGVKANPVMDNSPAAQYAKELSQKMAARTE